VTGRRLEPAARPGRALDGGIDLLPAVSGPDDFVFVREGAGVTGDGVASRALVEAGPAHILRAAEAAEGLVAAAGRRDVVVVGALPFAGDVPALLTIPTKTVIRDLHGHVAEVTVEATELAPWSTSTNGAHAGAAPPDASPAQYLAAVREALRRIDAGELRKVVLARSRTVAAPADPAMVLRRLAARDPHCHVFASAIPGRGVIAGATPEVLLRRRGDLVFSTPLAGSAARGGDGTSDRDAADRLFASAKDRAEHRLVVEAVADTLAPLCLDLRVDSAPSLSGTATVWHLSTNVRGVLRDRDLSALALAARLHPTPAVCGVPRDIARAAIAELEPVPRGFYAGLVGWVDGAGDGEWAITLRCAEMRDGVATLFAGAGIIEGSDPESELAETEMKFRAQVEALRTGV
jgi:isochorismate synthase